MVHAKAVLRKEISEHVFWQEEAPLLDPGDALLRVASRLSATADQLGMRLDRQIREYDERTDWGSAEACACCGHEPTTETLDKGIQDLWKFTTKETANVMGMIQKIGLAERRVRLEEAQAFMVAQGMQAMFEALNIPESDQLRGRQILLSKMKELEEAPGPGDGPSALPILDVEWSVEVSESPLTVEEGMGGPPVGPVISVPAEDVDWL